MRDVLMIAAGLFFVVVGLVVNVGIWLLLYRIWRNRRELFRFRRR